ncbi:MAG: methyltransferase domain-containing protein, partial [Gemmatimonadota bacterium]
MGTDHVGSAETEGMVIHWAGFYDWIMTVMFLGREARFRRRMLDAADLQPGQHVLDVGCGTGTLAVAAAIVVGDDGRVFGVDPAGEMIARARRKAEEAGADVELDVAAVESLPYPDGCMDVVISTLVFHHLTRRLQGLAVAEMRRVLLPGGRLVVIDFGGARQIGRLTAHATAV